MDRSLSARTDDLSEHIDLHARQILVRLARRATEPITVHVRNRSHEVRIQVNPVNLTEPPPIERYPGAWLSPLELLVWRAFEENQALSGKQIAARTGQEYGPKLKYLLLNMEDRGLLTHDTGVGYTRISADEKSAG